MIIKVNSAYDILMIVAILVVIMMIDDSYVITPCRFFNH